VLDPTTDASASESAERSRWFVLALSALLFVCSQFYRVANAVVATELRHDLGLSSEALGSLSAAFFYAFAVAQVPLALFLDRVGARRTMTVLSLVGTGGAVVFATAGGQGSATVGRVLLGIGMAGNLMGSMKLIGQWFSPREFATLSGVLATFGAVGNILATTPLALLVSAVGWRHSFLLVAGVTFALTVLFFVVVRDRPTAAETSPGAAEVLTISTMVRRLVSSKDYWIISLGTFCRYGTFLAIQGLWAGPYLVDVVGLSTVQAANLLLVLNLAAVLGAPFGGWLSDRALSSRKAVALVALGGTSMALAALAVVPGRPSLWVLIAVVFAFLGVTSSFGQVMYAHVKELMPLRMAGMAMSGVNFFTMLGAAAFLHGMGWVLDHGYAGAGSRGPDAYRAAFLVGSSAAALAFAAYCLTRDPPEMRARKRRRMNDYRHSG
jgi:nitrate/nitrite transporter NarK